MHRCVGFHVGFEQQPLYHVHKSLHRYRRAPANWLPLTRVMHRNCKRWNCISVSFSQPLPPSLSLRRSLSVSLCRSAVSCCRAPYLCCLLSGPVVVVVATYASSLCVPVFQMHLTRTFPSCQFSFPSFPFPFSFVSFLCIYLSVYVCVDFPKRFQSTHTEHTTQERKVPQSEESNRLGIFMNGSTHSPLLFCEFCEFYECHNERFECRVGKQRAKWP